MCVFGVMPSMLHKDPFPEHKMLQYIHPSIHPFSHNIPIMIMTPPRQFYTTSLAMQLDFQSQAPVSSSSEKCRVIVDERREGD